MNWGEGGARWGMGDRVETHNINGISFPSVFIAPPCFFSVFLLLDNCTEAIVLKWPTDRDLSAVPSRHVFVLTSRVSMVFCLSSSS